MQPNFMFSWPHAKIGVAPTEYLCRHSAQEYDKLLWTETQYNCSAMIHDGIILPSETRKVHACQCHFYSPFQPYWYGQVIQQCLDIITRYDSKARSDQTCLPVLRM